MKNDFIPFCMEFARKYKSFPSGYCLSANGGNYVIQKKELDNSGHFYTKTTPVRVNNETGLVQININLDQYSESAITFLLVWGFLRFIHQKEDSIPISDIEIDKKTIEALKDIPGFSLKEALVDIVTFVLSEKSTSDFYKRMENLIK